MNRINRSEYLDFLCRSRDRKIIKVVSGVRRCGKSTLFEIYHDVLRADGVDESQIISINFEDLAYEHLTHYRALYDYVQTRLQPDKMNYVFLDEIQHVGQFEKVVDSLFVQPNVDIYITGSNAYFMSSELATLLGGRYIELKMLPLSFAEYCEGISLQGGEPMTNAQKYAAYLENSSFPYTLQLDGRRKDIQEYLSGLYNSILLKDVVARLRISDVMMLESVVRFVFDNIGNILSLRKIANTMTSEGRKIDEKTVERYLRGLMESLLVYQAKRYSIKGKKLLALNEKYYVADVGLRQFLFGGGSVDQGRVLENIVYLELLRRGYNVSVGHMTDGEVDFVSQDDDGITYYQVALTVLDESTLRRELSSLEKINDSYPKVLLTLDDIGAGTSHNGIKQVNVLHWLLSK